MKPDGRITGCELSQGNWLRLGDKKVTLLIKAPDNPLLIQVNLMQMAIYLALIQTDKVLLVQMVQQLANIIQHITSIYKLQQQQQQIQLN